MCMILNGMVMIRLFFRLNMMMMVNSSVIRVIGLIFGMKCLWYYVFEM